VQEHALSPQCSIVSNSSGHSSPGGGAYCGATSSSAWLMRFKSVASRSAAYSGGFPHSSICSGVSSTFYLASKFTMKSLVLLMSSSSGLLGRGRPRSPQVGPVRPSSTDKPTSFDQTEGMSFAVGVPIWNSMSGKGSGEMNSPASLTWS
jgi:hypothetical protein